jgi:transposase InsO family protein
MPWQEVSTVLLRQEFVMLATAEGANVRALCRRYTISPKTGYKWLARYRRQGRAGVTDRSRRPHRSPTRTAPALERAVLAVRAAHPVWGGRKIRAVLLARGHPTLPSPSTMTAILKRHGQIAPEAAPKHTPWQRFEHDAPNRLWQMDFKGHFALLAGRCHPLTVLDDHSRFAVGLQACGDETGRTVQSRLTACFRRYGLPEALLVDNGPPWGSDAAHPHTPLTAWLLRLGVRVSHGRPYHPQTQGKDERFHRTLKAEVLGTRVLRDLAACQRAFDRWRDVYNLERPHDALGLAVPASRYRASPRAFPEVLPPIEYGPADLVRKVSDGGELSYRNRTFRVGKAFCGYPVALRPTLVDGVLDVFFCHQRVAQVNLRNHEELH